MQYVYNGSIYTKCIYIWYSFLLFCRRPYHESHAATLFREVLSMTISLGVWIMSILISASLSASLGFLLAACLKQNRDSCGDNISKT